MTHPLSLLALVLTTTQTQNVGQCVGYAMVTAPKTDVQHGPDFDVSSFVTSAGTVQIYVGCCSEVSNDKKSLFLTIDHLPVWRTSGTKGFSGYLVTYKRPIDGAVYETQHHFFGSGLTGDARDRAFFSTVRFGKVAARKCESKR